MLYRKVDDEITFPLMGRKIILIGESGNNVILIGEYCYYNNEKSILLSIVTFKCYRIILNILNEMSEIFKLNKKILNNNNFSLILTYNN